jgi:hypothetical protein
MPNIYIQFTIPSHILETIQTSSITNLKNPYSVSGSTLTDLIDHQFGNGQLAEKILDLCKSYTEEEQTIPTPMPLDAQSIAAIINTIITLPTALDQINKRLKAIQDDFNALDTRLSTTEDNVDEIPDEFLDKESIEEIVDERISERFQAAADAD